MFLFIGYQLYSEKCVKEGVVTQEQVKQIYDSYQKICEDSHDEAQKETSMKVQHFLGQFHYVSLILSYISTKIGLTHRGPGFSKAVTLRVPTSKLA